MPKYRYHCTNCDHDFEIYHSMKEKLSDCEECNEESVLKRVPYIPTVKFGENTAGSIVKEAIEDARQEVRKDKKRMKEEEYK